MCLIHPSGPARYKFNSEFYTKSKVELNKTIIYPEGTHSVSSQQLGKFLLKIAALCTISASVNNFIRVWLSHSDLLHQ